MISTAKNIVGAQESCEILQAPSMTKLMVRAKVLLLTLLGFFGFRPHLESTGQDASRPDDDIDYWGMVW